MEKRLSKENRLPEKRFNELLDKIREYNPDFRRKQLKKAFDFSKKIHIDQYRDNGEPYITHPLEVAIILTEYFADEATIIAAILHDTVEDSEKVTPQKIRDQFGTTVSKLVDGVTKIEQIIPEDDPQSPSAVSKRKISIETIRKIFQKSKQDIRVILIKLADRLHNMRTITGKKGKEKQRNKAEETLSIFTQVAARLGIWRIKRELESLCFRYVYPEEHKRIQSFLKNQEEKRKKLLIEVKTYLQKKDTDHVIIKILPYPRSLSAFQKILKEKNNLTINNNLVLQVLAEDENNCYLMLRLIHSLWKHLGKDEDFISNPRDNGYQAYHTEIVSQEGNRVQFRIMTLEMQRKNWYGITYDYFQKQKGAKSWFSSTSFDQINKSTVGKSEDFLEAAKTDLLERKIEVHTKGKSLDMPRESTALDFSFYAFPEKAIYTSKIFINDKE